MHKPERRRGVRLARTFPVRYHLSGQSQAKETCALDVSDTGVRIVTPSPLPLLPMELTLELEPQLKLSLFGQPVWQQPLNRAGDHCVGVLFDPGQDNEVRLRRYLVTSAEC